MAVEQKFTGSADQLLKEYEKVLKQQQNLEDKLQRLTNESKKTAKGFETVGGSIKTATGEVREMVRQYATLQGAATLAANAISLITEKEREKSDAARKTQLDVGQSQVSIIKNIGNDVDDETAKRFIDDITNIRKSTGFKSVVPLNVAASELLSATAGDQQKTKEILSKIASLFKDKENDLSVFGGIVGDFMKQSGVRDVDTVTATLLGIQGQARFASMSDLKYFAKAAATAVAANAGQQSSKEQDVREAGAIFAAITTMTGDTTGEVSKTNASALFSKLGGLSKGGVFSDIEALRKSSKEDQDKFFESGFSIDARDVMKTILDSTSEFSKTISKAYSEIRPEGNITENKRRQIETLTPELRRSSESAKWQGSLEDAQRQSQVEASQSREIYDKYGRPHSYGLGHVSDRITDAVNDAWTGWSYERTKWRLEQRRDALVTQRAWNETWGGEKESDPNNSVTKEIQHLNEGIMELVRLQRESNQIATDSAGANSAVPIVAPQSQSRNQEGADN